MAGVKVFKEAYFYPRPPRGGRRLAGLLRSPPCKFLSTPSARRATRSHLDSVIYYTISIHALREEGDHGRSSTVP